MSITNCTVLTAIITKRIGTQYHIYSKLKDFVLDVNNCPTDYAVGKWLSLEIQEGVLKKHTTCFVENAPESRVVNGRTQILTYGSFICEEDGSIIKCNTVDFALVGILPNVDISNISVNSEYAVWTRRLDKTEEEEYLHLHGECLKWGILSVAGQFLHNFEIGNTNRTLLPWPTSYITLKGIVTKLGARQNSGEYIAYVWTISYQLGVEGIIICHDSPENMRMNIGQWLHFGLPRIEYERTFKSKSLNQPRFQIENGNYILVKPKYITRNVSETLELDIPSINVSEDYILGADFWHAEVGWISDPLRYLRPGIILDATVIYQKSRSDSYCMWKLISICNVRHISNNNHHSINENPSQIVNLPNSTVAVPKKATATVKKINQSVRREFDNASLKYLTYELLGINDQLIRQKAKKMPIFPMIKSVHLERAMVEFYDNKRNCIFLWLIDSHQDSIFFSPNKLQPGHCFEGQFTVDNIEKKVRCEKYIRGLDLMIDGKISGTGGKFEVYINVKFNNRRNGHHFEAYNDFFGFILDSHNLLFVVTEEIEVPVTIKKLSYEGRFIWQIMGLREQHTIMHHQSKQEQLVELFSKVMNYQKMRDVIRHSHPAAYKFLSRYYNKRE